MISDKYKKIIAREALEREALSCGLKYDNKTNAEICEEINIYRAL